MATGDTSYPNCCKERDAAGRRCLLSAGHLERGKECLGSDRQFDYFPMEQTRFLSYQIQIHRLDPRATLPTRSHEGDAGWDLYVLEDVRVPPYTFLDIRTGVAIAPPDNLWARVVGRSSTVRNRGLLVIEGVIDTGWRADLIFGVRNLTGAHVDVQAGDRLAQLIIQRHVDIHWEEVGVLPEGDRGNRGFGSTGL
jgi:dUTP pyrophosphatase